MLFGNKNKARQSDAVLATLQAQLAERERALSAANQRAEAAEREAAQCRAQAEQSAALMKNLQSFGQSLEESQQSLAVMAGAMKEQKDHAASAQKLT